MYLVHKRRNLKGGPGARPKGYPPKENYGTPRSGGTYAGYRKFHPSGLHVQDIVASAPDPAVAGAQTLAHMHTLEGPPPCFFFSQCKAHSVCYRQGKSVCAACAAGLTGQIRPLLDPRALPPYGSQVSAAKAMGMTGVMHYF